MAEFRSTHPIRKEEPSYMEHVTVVDIRVFCSLFMMNLTIRLLYVAPDHFGLPMSRHVEYPSLDEFNSLPNFVEKYSGGTTGSSEHVFSCSFIAEVLICPIKFLSCFSDHCSFTIERLLFVTDIIDLKGLTKFRKNCTGDVIGIARSICLCSFMTVVSAITTKILPARFSPLCTGYRETSVLHHASNLNDCEYKLVENYMESAAYTNVSQNTNWDYSGRQSIIFRLASCWSQTNSRTTVSQLSFPYIYRLKEMIQWVFMHYMDKQLRRGLEIEAERVAMMVLKFLKEQWKQASFKCSLCQIKNVLIERVDSHSKCRKDGNLR